MEKVDWFKRIIDSMSLIVVVSGLYFAYDQATQFNRSLNLSNWSDVTARTIEVDKVFVDHPDDQKYFIGGAPIDARDQNYTRISALAEMMLDYFDSVMTRLDFNRGHLSNDILQESAWDHYFLSTFHTSPIMCKLLMDDPASYGYEMRRIGIPACAAVARRRGG